MINARLLPSQHVGVFFFYFDKSRIKLMTEVASESRQRWTAPFKVFILTHGVRVVVLAEKLNQNIHRGFFVIPGHNTHSEQGSCPVVYKHVLNGETTFSSLVIDAYLLATLAAVKGTTQPRFINKTYAWHSNTDVRVSVHFFSIDGIETTRTNGKISSHSSGSLADVGCTGLRPTLQQQSTTTSFGMNEPLASSGCAIVCSWSPKRWKAEAILWQRHGSSMQWVRVIPSSSPM